MIKRYDWHKTQMRERCGGVYVLYKDEADSYEWAVALSDVLEMLQESVDKNEQQLISDILIDFDTWRMER